MYKFSTCINEILAKNEIATGIYNKSVYIVNVHTDFSNGGKHIVSKTIKLIKSVK